MNPLAVGYRSNWFIYSAAAILGLTGAAKLYSVVEGKSQLLSQPEPISGVSFGLVFLLVGLVEFAIAITCFTKTRRQVRLGLLTWIAFSITVYRVELWLMGWTQPCTCVGTLLDPLGSPVIIDSTMKLILVYFLVGSLISHFVQPQRSSNREFTSTTHPRPQGPTAISRKWPRRKPSFTILSPHFITVSVLHVISQHHVLSETTGYQALGHLSYTLFDSSDRPIYKECLLFDVYVIGDHWRIRTEPVVQKPNGIVYYDTWLTSNCCVIAVTALAPVNTSAESPLQKMRRDLLQTRQDDIAFASESLPVDEITSSLVARTGGRAVFRLPSTVSPQDALIRTNRVGNTSITRLTSGAFPSPDPSFASVLCFVFTPPTVLTEGKDRFLPQMWDDGSAPLIRFRAAVWQQCPDLPYLVCTAQFAWQGMECLPGGKSRPISIQDVSSPLDTAARYLAEGSTNVGGHVLPVKFSVTRFDPRLLQGRPLRVTSVDGVAVAFNVLTTAVLSEPTVPDRTYAIDYRVSAGELKGKPVNYAMDTNGVPSVERLVKSPAYKRTLTASRLSASGRYESALLFGVLLLVPILATMFWRTIPYLRKQRTDLQK